MCRITFTRTGDCCCCIKGETAAKLIGYFYIVLHVLSLIGPIVELRQFRKEKLDDEEWNVVEENGTAAEDVAKRLNRSFVQHYNLTFPSDIRT